MLRTESGLGMFLASRWACKEALVKALGVRRGESLRFADVEVVSEGNAPPSFVFLSPAWRERTKSLSFSLSLSHEGDMSAAVCVAFVENQ